MSKRRKKKNPWTLPLLCVCALLSLVCALSLFVWFGNYAHFRVMRDAVRRDTFYEGITVNGIDVSDMTLSHAAGVFAERDRQSRNAHGITLTLDGDSWSADAETLRYQSDYGTVLSRAWTVARYGSLPARYEAVRKLREGAARAFSVHESYDKDRLRELVGTIADAKNVAASMPTVRSFDDETGAFTFTEARNGLAIDEEEILRDADDAIAKGGGTVPVTLHEVNAREAEERMKASYGMISSASTDASSSNKNRLNNLKVACYTISGLKIDPGQSFSFNETLGKRTKDKGYKSAGAIENGLTTEQVGGGICQVSTTLFNAVVKADLTVTERSPHSRPSVYIDPGKDAAVNWPSQDFKFKNTSDDPVYIQAYVTKGKRVVISIYGKLRADGVTIELDSERTATMQPGADRYVSDPTLAPGQEVVAEKARKGYKATTYKVYYDKSGNEIRREVLCKSTYPASGAVIRVGT